MEPEQQGSVELLVGRQRRAVQAVARRPCALVQLLSRRLGERPLAPLSVIPSVP